MSGLIVSLDIFDLKLHELIYNLPCNERIFKTNFSPEKQEIVHYTQYMI